MNDDRQRELCRDGDESETRQQRKDIEWERLVTRSRLPHINSSDRARAREAERKGLSSRRESNSAH
jgi:hypothetical protein